jgi:hypothetical protein
LSAKTGPPGFAAEEVTVMVHGVRQQRMVTMVLFGCGLCLLERLPWSAADTLLNHVSCCLFQAAKKKGQERLTAAKRPRRSLLLPKGQKELAAAEELAVAENCCSKGCWSPRMMVCLVKMGRGWATQFPSHRPT